MTKRHLLGINPKAGNCHICGDTTLLTHQCQVTAFKVGKCCIESMLRAEAVLTDMAKRGGPSHPDAISH
jgi:hypothetical protein